MKKLFFVFVFMLPFMAIAKTPVSAKYLKGGVPEENGVIVFRKSFSVPNMQTEQIYTRLYNYVNNAIISPAIHEKRTRITSDGKEDGVIVARVEDNDGKNGESYKAEEWISDAEAINKKGTKLYPRSGKFRIKTIDRIEEIFEDCMDTFEDKRKNVIED